MKKIIGMLFLCFTLLGCTKDSSPTFTYQLDGNDQELNKNQTVEQLCYEEESTAYLYDLYYDKEYDQYEKDYDTEKDTQLHLSFNGIQIGSTIEQTIQNAKIEKDCAYFNYEYDPYHDGCTEIESGIYDGTIIDFNENNVLDYILQQRYDYINDKWIIHNYKEEKNVEHYVIINYTFSGSSSLYNQEQGKIMALTISYY